MKNKYTYQFLIGKRKINFDSNTEGNTYDKAVHYQQKNMRNTPGKPTLVKKLNVQTVAPIQ